MKMTGDCRNGLFWPFLLDWLIFPSPSMLHLQSVTLNLEFTFAYHMLDKTQWFHTFICHFNLVEFLFTFFIMLLLPLCEKKAWRKLLVKHSVGKNLSLEIMSNQLIMMNRNVNMFWLWRYWFHVKYEKQKILKFPHCAKGRVGLGVAINFSISWFKCKITHALQKLFSNWQCPSLYENVIMVT